MNRVYGAVALLVLLAVLGAGFAVGKSCGEHEEQVRAEKALRDKVEQLESTHSSTLRKKQKEIGNLSDLLDRTKGQLDEKTSEAAVLAELVGKLRGKLKDVHTVVQVDKVFLPGEEVRIEVPFKMERHDLVRWEDSTPVASVDLKDGELVAKACKMEFKLREAHSKGESSFLLFARSGCDGVLRDTPITDVAVTRIDSEKPKLFSPRLGLGFTGGATIPGAAPLLGASVYLELLHPTKNIALFSPQFTVGTHLAGGMNLIGYNVGAPLPLVDDLWVHLGVGYGAPLVVTTPEMSIPKIGTPTWGAWVTIGTQL